MNKAVPLLIVFVTVFAVASTANYARATTTYTYTLHGPYYEDGGVANADVGVAVLWVNGSILRFTMRGDGVTANTTTFSSTNAAFQILWNASTPLNFTRVIDLLSANETLNIYIPSPLVPAGLYSFSVSDFANMKNPYLQTSISTDGATYNVVERRSLNTTGTLTFVMAQYGTYTLTFLSSQGTFSQIFTAENVFSTNLPVLAGAFPNPNVTVTTVSAERFNSSLIGIAYFDPSTKTDWVNVAVTHRSGSIIVNDYAVNNTGSSQTILWNDADADKSYMVNVTAQINGVQRNYIFQVATEPSANPFLGIFDWLGVNTPTLPHVQTGWPTGMTSFQIAQIGASLIILFFLCIGSFRSTGATCVLAWLVGGIMIYLGWYGQTGAGVIAASTIPTWSLAGVLSVFIALQEGKDTVREA